MFGTGILRIKEMYENYKFKPDFKVYENSISVILPLINLKPQLTLDESKIVDYLSKGFIASSSELIIATGFSKDKLLRLIKSLTSKGFIKVSGEGRATKYSL